MKIVLAALALALALCSAALRAQVRVTVADLGPGASGRILQEALARPHRLIEPDTGWFVLGRGEQERGTIIVLGRTAAIAGRVEGDVIVVGGDLFVRPGADISERAIAIGGGTYPSALARVAKGSQSFRDNTFEIVRTIDGYRLEYRSLREAESPPLLFPGIYGLRLPSYDRVNGASVPFGPAFTFAGGRGELNAVATYRSDLGKIDPSIAASLEMSRRLRAMVRAERGTFSNDAWIWSNFVNSLSVLVFGIDTRNYYRADRAELTVHRLWEFTRTQIEPFVGVRGERAWSVGPGISERRGPWSVWGRTDSLGIFSPNPAVPTADIYSVVAGSTLEWESEGLRLRGQSLVERSIEASKPSGSIVVPPNFSQVTTDLGVGFLTFGEQEYGMNVHWVTTLGDTPPLQRFVYMGGSGTLPFLDLLEQGGGELLLIDQRYAIPLLNIRVGMLGNPTLQFRHRLGSAGLSKLPSFEQVIGVGVSLTIIRGELQMDPSSGKVRASVGFTFSR